MKNQTSNAINVIDFYNTEGMAESYFNDNFVRRDISSARAIRQIILEKLPGYLKPKGGLLVDLGCGPGNNITRMVDAFSFNEVVAVDASKEMVSFVRDNIKTNNLKVQLANLTKDKIDAVSESVDLAISCLTMSYLCDLENVFSEVGRIMKRGSIFAFDIVVHQERHKSKIQKLCENIPVYEFICHRGEILLLAQKNGLYPVYIFNVKSIDVEADIPTSSFDIFFLVKR